MSDQTAAAPLSGDTGVDDEPVEGNRRLFEGWAFALVAGLATAYAAFHMAALNGVSLAGLTGGAVRLPFLPTFPLETWNFRIVHIAGALALGFTLFAGARFAGDGRGETPLLGWLAWLLALPALFSAGVAVWFGMRIQGGVMWNGIDATIRFQETWLYGAPLIAATVGAIVLSWFHRRARGAFSAPDLVLAICGAAVAIYLITIFGTLMRNATGTPFAPIGMSIAAVAGVLLIMELTRRVAGMALVIISGVFLAYVFAGQYLPGFLNSPPITWQRFFSQVYTDAGVLGPTTAVSSTYIILFIIFAAFLQASKVGDYFVKFAFAVAGRARGGPAKVAIFASGLMGMINGTSAGNVVATGSLTIPLMKRIGYRPQTSASIEAAASTGGQIMPPIMGAGAFIMAEITGIAYTDIAIAAIIPAVLYFTSIYFMVDFEAQKLGMRGMSEDEIPKLAEMLRQVFLFIPILILIIALFMGYSVIRAGTLATVAAVVVSWAAPEHFSFSARATWGLQRILVLGIALTSLITAALYFSAPVSDAGVTEVSPTLVALGWVATALIVAAFFNVTWRELSDRSVKGLGFQGLTKAFELAGVMSIQIIAVCACAGVIVGVISLTGVGARFSNLLLGIADTSQFLALFFAMLIAILLGMGMPTTAAYAVAASVVAPGLVQLGIQPLTAHFFVFYYAVISAITPPVALASYAGAAIAGSEPMRTSVESFKIGLAAFVVPFMFFYSPGLLLVGDWVDIGRNVVTALVGVWLLSAAVQGFFFGRLNAALRLGLLAGALCMIAGGWATDAAGVGLAAAVWFVQTRGLMAKPA